MSNITSLLLILILCLPVFPGLWACDTPDVQRQVAEDPPEVSERCQQCHPDTYAAWQQSSHAEAWTSLEFQDSLALTGTPACLGCHAPAPVIAGGKVKPLLRQTNWIEGVNCAACHGISCPRDSSRSTLSDHDKGANLCGACHRGTYKEWEKYQVGRDNGTSCVECHMPILEANHSSLIHHDHTFPMKIENPIYLSIEEKPPQEDKRVLEILLYNSRAGHALPTGHYGYSEIRMEVWLEGEEADARIWRFFVENDGALQPGPNGPFRYEFAPLNSQVHTRVVRVDADGRVLETLLEHSPVKEIDSRP